MNDFQDGLRDKVTQAAITALVNQEYYPRAVAIGQELQRWLESAKEHGVLSSKWLHPVLSDTSSCDTVPRKGRGDIDLNLLREALLMNDYWGLCIAQEIVIDMICSKIQSRPLVDLESAKNRRERLLQLSRNIFATAKYLAFEEHGFNAASRCTLPTRVALYPLRTYGGPDTDAFRDEAEEFVLGLTSGRGVRYAAALMNRTGKWHEGSKVTHETASDG